MKKCFMGCANLLVAVTTNSAENSKRAPGLTATALASSAQHHPPSSSL